MEGRGTFDDLDRFAFFQHYYYQQVKMVRFAEIREGGVREARIRVG